jgi:type VI secretion system secreted protein VgrG
MDPLSLLTDAAPALSGLLGGLTQAQRLLRVHTPLGDDVMFAEDVEAWEGVGPANGPALGDAEFDGGSAMAVDVNASWAFDASLGPTRAGMRLVVHALASDAHLELKTLIGQPALVEMLCQDSAIEMRPWHGHVVAAGLMGSDGGLARYRLVIEPWLSALAHNVDAWAYQDMSVPQILDDLFGGYGGQGQLAPAWRWDLADAGVYPKRSLCIQYHESDLDFALRLMREEGLFCWWEHAGDATSASLGAHTLVIADHNGAFATNTQAVVRFTASDHALDEDSLERWTSVNRVASASVAMRSRDHRGLGSRPVEASAGDAAPMGELAIVDVPGAYAYEDIDQGQRLASRQAEALAAVRTRAVGRGPWRRAQVGTSFTLADHPRHDGTDPTRDTFVVLAAQHRARNNFSADEKARFVGLAQAILRDQGQGGKPARDDDAPLHEAALLAQPLAVPVRVGGADPQPHAVARDGRFGVFGRIDERALAAQPSLFDTHAVTSLSQPEVRLNVRPSVRGTQTAIVVGDGGGDLHTDRDGRVRVQFHWQRGGGSSHRMTGAGGDNAPASASSFTWVRVGQSLAGGNFGAVFTPRVGQEVLVAFTGGDIDRPVVVGAVYNGQGTPDAQGNQVAAGAVDASGNAPAWFPGTQAAGAFEGHQHTAVMLGHKSQELGASTSGLGGSNQLVFDDSAAGNRIELSTTTQATRLQLGALLHQQDNQRLAPRGHGLELATGAHGALRAGSGLLVSAHAQAASTSGGLQLEANDATSVLQSAQSLIHTLADSAQAHNAKLAGEPAVAGATAKDTSKQLPVEQGLHALADSLDGSSTKGATDGAGASDGDTLPIDGGFGSVPAWDRPDLVLAAPSGIGLFTPASAMLASGGNIACSAGQDLHAIAQGNHATVAQGGVVLYTYGKADDASKPNTETGIALHAASGSVVSSSNTGATRLTSSGAIDVSSTKTSVLVASPRQVLLAAAGAAIQIDAGNITINAPGAVEFKAGQKNLTSAAAASAPAITLPTASLVMPDRFSAHLDVYDYFVQHDFRDVPFTAKLDDGAFVSGVLDKHGRSQPVYASAQKKVEVLVGESKDEWDLIFDHAALDRADPSDQT